MRTTYDEAELSKIIAMFRRRLTMIIILPLLSAMVAGILVYRVITPVYEASTTLMVGRNEGANTQTVLGYQDVLLNQQLVKAYGEIAKSRIVAEEVIKRMGLNTSIEQFQKKIDVSLLNGMPIIRLSALDADPVVAQSIANTTAVVFVKRVPEVLKLNNVTVVDPAFLPVSPAKPKKALTVAVAAIVGEMVAMLLVVLLEALDNTIKSKAEAEKLVGSPVIGMIPKIDRPSEGGEARKRSTKPVALIHDSKSRAIEAYRSLGTNILFCGIDQPIRTLAVTSSTPSEGKSTTVVNLAVSMAQAGQHVVVIDADLRRPMLHKVFDIPNNIGLTSILIGDKHALDKSLHATQITGLSILPSGPVPPNPTQLLGTHRFKELLDSISEYADYVIVDTPPVVAFTDAAIVGSRVGGIIMVLDSSTARRPALLQAKSILENVKANILGVVLNQVQEKTGDYYYYGQRQK